MNQLPFPGLLRPDQRIPGTVPQAPPEGDGPSGVRAINRLTTLEDRPMNVADACQVFLRHCKSTKNLSPHTLRAYCIDLREFCRFVDDDRTIDSCDKHLLRAYLAFLFEQRSLKETSIKRRIACLKAMFQWLEDDEIIELNPFHRFKTRIRIPARLPRTLTRTEIRKLLSTARREIGLCPDDGYDRLGKRIGKDRESFNRLTTLLALELLFCTGVRVGELVSITIPDIDLDNGVITIIGKGNRQRRVFLPDADMLILVRHYITVRLSFFPTHDLLFTTTRGNQVVTDLIRKLLKTVADQAGLTRHVTPHMFRHSTATYLLENGVDIRYVQRLLGHQCISTTQIYTHVTDSKLQEVVCGAGLRGVGR